MIFLTGNGIIQTGNGITYPIYRPLIKILLLQNVSHFYPESSKLIFETGNVIIQTEKAIIFPTSIASRPLIKNPFLQNIFVKTPTQPQLNLT